MALERIKPEVQRTNLGCVRMWQEELAEIVRLVGLLPDVKVRIEADNYTLTDVVADLPRLGQRVSSFSVIAERPADGVPHEVVSVKLAKQGSCVEAADPDLDTYGLIGKIADIAKRRRRLPAKLEPYFDITAPNSGGAALVLVVLAGVPGVIFGIGAVQHLMHPHHAAFTAWPTSIFVAITGLLIVAAGCFGWYRARTTLFTAPHQAAQTWWERNSTAIVINVITSAIFLGIGWLIHT